MPKSVVVLLKSARQTILPNTTGPALHAAFFKWLDGLDKELAAELHDAKGLKPFAVSDITPLSPGQKPRKFGPATPGWFRICSFYERLDRVLEAPNLPESFQILSEDFQVLETAQKPFQHPWANWQSWEDLIKAGQSRGPQPLSFEFFSPATFKVGDHYLPVPLPENVFGCLLARWNAFCPYKMEYGEKLFNLVINRYKLSTELVFLEGARSRSRFVCFTGFCEYALTTRDKNIQGALNTLTLFASYCGVGYKTTMGFGQVKPVWE